MSLSYDEEYGQCPRCSHVFVISVFNKYATCNYDGVVLTHIGQDYPEGDIPVGDRNIILRKKR